MDIRLFDNFEDDGQLSMFDMAEDIERLQTPLEEEEQITGNMPGAAGAVREELPVSGSAGIRIQKCSSCGKLLFVKEESDCYVSACNACSISYMQKK